MALSVAELSATFVADVAVTETVVASSLASSIASSVAGLFSSTSLTSLALNFVAGQAISALFGARRTSSAVAAAATGALINGLPDYAGIPVLYGSRRFPGVRILTEVSNGSGGEPNAFLHVIVVWGEGPVDAITQVYLDDTPITDPSFSGGFAAVENYLGTDSQAASASLIGWLGGKWTVNDTLSGIAYSYVKLAWNPTLFPRGLPVITADIRGRTLYDPRTGLTAYSNNPALCIRDYLTSTRYGLKAPSAMIDDTAFISAANHCDESLTVATATGTTTQVRYTCDGLIDIDNTRLDNLRTLLSTCRGFLVYSGGQYKLKNDRLTTPVSFTLNEDNIVGSWKIALPTRRGRINRVRATFIDGANLYQPNVAVQDAPAYRTADGNVLIEQQVDLPMTCDGNRAGQIAQQVLAQGRFGIVCQLTATVAALQLEVGDVVPVTHSTPGWSSQLFRVVMAKPLGTDEVQLTLAQYDASVYTLGTLPYVNPPPATNLPDPRNVAAPGIPAVTENQYQTSGSAGVKSKATMAWAASTDPFVQNGGSYQAEYQAASDSVWSIAGLVQSSVLSVDVFDLAAGSYNFRVKAISLAGVASPYATRSAVQLLGLTTPPEDVTGFSVVASQGVALCSWNLTTNLAVKIGGRVQVRWSPKTTGATWQDGIILEEFNGDAATGLTSLMTGTYLAKFKTPPPNNVFSVNTASFVATEGMVTGFNTVLTRIEDAAFVGTKANVAAVAGVLKIDSANTITGQPGNVSTWPRISSLGGIRSSGTYTFGYDDLSTVAVRRWQGTVQALSFDTGDTISSRTGNVSTWNSISGSVINDCDATLCISTTNDDPAGTPAWSAYTPFFVGDFSCRAARYQLRLDSAAPTHNIQVSQLRITAKTPVSP